MSKWWEEEGGRQGPPMELVKVKYTRLYRNEQCVMVVAERSEVLAEEAVREFEANRGWRVAFPRDAGNAWDWARQQIVARNGASDED